MPTTDCCKDYLIFSNNLLKLLFPSIFVWCNYIVHSNKEYKMQPLVYYKQAQQFLS